VKYLSSPKLMRLQLSDAAFRRHFLVQALVFLNACQHPGRAQKDALKPKQACHAETHTPGHDSMCCGTLKWVLTGSSLGTHQQQALFSKVDCVFPCAMWFLTYM